MLAEKEAGFTCNGNTPHVELERAAGRKESPVFFRFGWFENIKINLMSFSKIVYEKDKYYKIDILLDWDLKMLALFVNGEYMSQVEFFTMDRDEMIECDKTFVNALMLYTLTPGVTSTYKDIKLCSELCPGT